MHRTHRLSWPLLAALLTVLVTASPAAADYRDVYKECENGRLTSKFSAKELQQAAQRMNSYQRDYTNCSDAIYAAQTGSGGGNQAGSRSGSNGGTSAGSGGGGSTTGSGGSGGGAAGGTGTSGSPSAGAPSDGPSAPGAPSNLSPDEKYIATQAATQQADAAGSLEQMLAAAKVPASALTYSSASAPMPLSLVIALAASAALALLAAVMSLLARYRRARVD